MERLSGMDAAFLYLETPSNQLHMTGVLVFDPSTMKQPYSFERMKEFMRERLPLSPAFTRKLVDVPLRIAHPVWVEDPDFDLDAHVHRVGIPSPGGPDELADLAGQIAGWPLDRRRPLWEMWFVEGLEHGHIGLVAKMHHSTIDGVSGANLMMHLFDLEPDAAPPQIDVPEPDKTPTDLELLGYGLLSRARRPLMLPKALGQTARAAVEMVGRRLQSDRQSMATPFTAPSTPFNGAITAHRRVALQAVSLADIREVKNAFGTTVNDVVLAVCGSAVRKWLIAHNALPDRPLIAGVPVSTRGDEETANIGNLISAMFVSLATDIEDPLRRLEMIHERTKDAKDEFKAVGADTLQNWTEFSGPRLFGLAMRLYSNMELADRHPPALNFLVSNVPGPPIPLYLAGGRLMSLYPLGPILDGMGLNITVLSFVDTVGFGFVACRELIPDLSAMAAYVPEALDELLSLAKQARPEVANATRPEAAKATRPEAAKAKHPEVAQATRPETTAPKKATATKKAPPTKAAKKAPSPKAT